MLNLNNIDQYYNQSHTLWDLSITLKAGACTCLLGRNGVGKTTLSKVIMGLLPVKNGEIIYDGKDITAMNAYRRAALGIGYVPQGREIFSQLSVRENLEIGVLGNRNKISKIPEQVYELFPVLKEMLERKGGDLSGGQQQQLAIGRALCIDPRLLILDEPSEGIQPNIVSQIGKVIDYLTKEKKITIVLVEQKLPFARKHGDDFFILERGGVVSQGVMSELSDDVVKKHLTV